MVRVILLIVSILLSIGAGHGTVPSVPPGPVQILQPVKWNYKADLKSAGEATLLLTAKIEKGWHLYSQNIPDGGPIKTTFTFTPSPDYEIVGEVTEGKAIEFYDKNFEMQLKYFANEAVFKQKIKLINPKSFRIAGTVEFMVCDDEKCLPPELVEFTVDINQVGSAVKEPAKIDSPQLVTTPVDTAILNKDIVPDTLAPDQVIRQDESPFTDLEEGCGEMQGETVGSSRVDLQACKLEYSIVSPK